MKVLRQKIDKITEGGLVVLMSLLVLDVLWQVASRYILRSPSSFTDELARYLLIWVALIGAAYATGKNMHLAIDILLLHRFIYLLILVFALLVMVVGGIRLVYISFALGQLAATLQVSLAYVYISLPVSGLLICFYCIHELIKGRAEV